jgi:ubiquinone/menaquinone biosynthesis C-methylase UbiE
MTTSTVTLQALKDVHRRTWASGDYAQIAQLVTDVGEQVAAHAGIQPGDDVLDVAAGTGNAAIPAAQAGAQVIATDLTPELFGAGRERAADAGVAIEWIAADAEDLPFEDARFDCVGSVFGAMIAPRPKVVAAELFRVVRPGGTVGMTAWTPDSFTARLVALGRSYAPPQPADVPLAEEWGVPETARERFEGLAGSIQTELRTLTWRSDSIEAMAEGMGASPPQMALKSILSEEQIAELDERTFELSRAANKATDGGVEIDSEYLEIVARRPG